MGHNGVSPRRNTRELVTAIVVGHHRSFQLKDRNFDPQPNLARVKVDLESGVAYLDLLGRKGALSDFPIIGNDDKVEVQMKDNDTDEWKGVTAGRHQLVGIRKWRVEKLSGEPLDVNLMTGAYEHARGWLNEFGSRHQGGRHDQKMIWTTYLKNIGNKVKDRFGGEVGEVKVDGPTPTGPSPNPFLDDLK